jgi:enterochelin esterase family protein
LLIVHDGDDYLRFANMKTVLDNLIQRHEVRPLIAVFTSGGASRNAEYAANPTAGEVHRRRTCSTR